MNLSSQILLPRGKPSVLWTKGRLMYIFFLYTKNLQTFDFGWIWSGDVWVGGWVYGCSYPLQVCIETRHWLSSSIAFDICYYYCHDYYLVRLTGQWAESGQSLPPRHASTLSSYMGARDLNSGPHIEQLGLYPLSHLSRPQNQYFIVSVKHLLQERPNTTSYLSAWHLSCRLHLGVLLQASCCVLFAVFF